MRYFLKDAERRALVRFYSAATDLLEFLRVRRPPRVPVTLLEALDNASKNAFDIFFLGGDDQNPRTMEEVVSIEPRINVNNGEVSLYFIIDLGDIGTIVNYVNLTADERSAIISSLERRGIALDEGGTYEADETVKEIGRREHMQQFVRSYLKDRLGIVI